MYVQNVHVWLKHKLTSVLAIGQLYHQSATAPGCTTQLQDVRGLPLFARRSVNQFREPFLTIFLFFFVLCSYQEITESVVEHRSLLISISFNQNCVFFSIILKYLPVINPRLHDSDVMFTSWIK